MPHFGDIKFLEHSLRRYKHVLSLKRDVQDMTMSSICASDVALLLNTHMLVPQVYKQDMAIIFGELPDFTLVNFTAPISPVAYQKTLRLRKNSDDDGTARPLTGETYSQHNSF